MRYKLLFFFKTLPFQVAALHNMLYVQVKLSTGHRWSWLSDRVTVEHNRLLVHAITFICLYKLVSYGVALARVVCVAK